ncbi:MAG: hypothetical protein EP326_05040 [Deltaproteobacteria bacterium]|nr:MAG: hypothetical protein EP326_05040 [Deltaproteobacteria bacterium]
MKKTALVCSVGLHLAVLNLVLDEAQNRAKKVKPNEEFKVKIMLNTLRKKDGMRKGLSMADLAPNFSNSKNFNDYDAKVLDAGSELNRYIRQIDQHLQYPDWLVKRNIQGQVMGHIMLSRNRLISLSFKSTSSSLKNYVIFVIKRALDQNFLETFGDGERVLIPMTFHFELSTGLEEEKIQTDAVSFLYRHAYGGDEPIDEINQGVSTVLGAIQNPLTLWKYRPDWMKSDKERTKEIFTEQIETSKL